jgi:hypothetical protein
VKPRHARRRVARARRRLVRAVRDETEACVPRVACRLCKAPKGEPCTKGTSGKKTRSHAERRRDAEAKEGL